MPRPDDPVQLLPDVQRLATALVGLDEGVAFDATVLAESRAKLTALPANNQREVAVQLAALAAKIERKGGPGTDLVLAQLMLLTVELVGSSASASDLFQKAGVVGATQLSADSTGPLPESPAPDKLWK